MPDSFLEMSTLGRSDSTAGGSLDVPVVRLTVLGHPVASRVGEVSVLNEISQVGGFVDVCRSEPLFGAGDRAQPLLSPLVSRQPIRLVRERTGIRLEPGEQAGQVRIEGRPVAEALSIPLADLDAGVVVRIRAHIVLLLHREVERDVVDALDMVGESQPLDVMRAHILGLRRSDAPVLIRGETGSGKEHVARALHASSSRRSGPFVAVNVAAIPPQLAASQLFGHVRGAFSGAHAHQDGLFVAAHGGTLFLDEVGEMPEEVQVALLRVLETGEVTPIGATRPRQVDVRVITATDADLEAAVDEKRFRGPLYWRLAATCIDVPPLRVRRADVGRLLVHFLRSILAGTPRAALLEPEPTERKVWLSADVVERLALYDWPGNVRELRNLAQTLSSLRGPRDPLQADDIRDRLRAAVPATPPGVHKAGLKPRQISPELLVETMEAVDWGLGAAAERLGISRPSLNELVDAHPNLKRAKFLTDTEIEAGRDRAARSGQPLWRELRVSSRALSRRLSGVDHGSR